eukprot:TRINITY_DN4223_c0_g1_i1.p1 TRINITY_DN4223_c0_g1~~TRINITY_DN4223_c0_g1_i1.p1  ORF type:complete len:201 (-),score=17.23 TRINITY_DN4223_c0_g1_i1:427-984(-)
MQCTGAAILDKDVSGDAENNLFSPLADDLVFSSLQFLEEPFDVNNNQLVDTLGLCHTSSSNNVGFVSQQAHNEQLQAANSQVSQVPCTTTHCVENWTSPVYDVHFRDQQTANTLQMDQQTTGSFQLDGIQQKVGGDNNIKDEGRQQQQQFQIDTTQQQQQQQQLQYPTFQVFGGSFISLRIKGLL